MLSAVNGRKVRCSFLVLPSSDMHSRTYLLVTFAVQGRPPLKSLPRSSRGWGSGIPSHSQMFPPCAEVFLPPPCIEHIHSFYPVRPFYYGMLHFPAKAANNPREGSPGSPATPLPSLDPGLAKPQLKQPSEAGPAGYGPPTYMELFLKGPTPLKAQNRPSKIANQRHPRSIGTSLGIPSHIKAQHERKGPLARRSSHGGPTLAWQRQAQKPSFGTQVAASAQVGKKKALGRGQHPSSPPPISFQLQSMHNEHDWNISLWASAALKKPSCCPAAQPLSALSKAGRLRVPPLAGGSSPLPPSGVEWDALIYSG